MGTRCLGPGGLGGPPDIGPQVRAAFERLAPHPDASFQPSDGAIVNLPTIFAAGPGPDFAAPLQRIEGYDVTITATASYTWHFDDGVERTFSVPGGAYPDKSVTWTYRDRGPRAVTVTIGWTGTYTVDGGAALDVPGGPLTVASPPLAVRVRDAHAVLVSEPEGAGRR